MDWSFQRNAMFPEKYESFYRFIERFIGRYLLHWVVTQANVWFLVYRCVDSVVKVHGSLDESFRILDRLLQPYEDDAVEIEDTFLAWACDSSYERNQIRRTG
jgi:hypothetical protein